MSFSQFQFGTGSSSSYHHQHSPHLMGSGGTVPPPSSSLSPDNGNNSNDTNNSNLQLRNNNHSGLTSPVPGHSTPGADSVGGGQGNGGGSAAVSPAIAASPPVPGVSLNFSASSLAGSSVTPSSGSLASNAMTASVDSVNGQLLAECDPARLAALSYPRLGAMAGSMYSAASYPSTEQNPYPSIAMENSFYGSLGNPAGAGTDMWSGGGLPPSTGYYGYDHPTLAAYGYGGGYDLASRRKNATRESTATLKAWLNEHKKNPYPTKGEKIMLAIITKMTLTQVSTWFANARRRLKKENKMTWEPKNKLDDEDVDVSDDDDKDRDDDKDLDSLHSHVRSNHLGHHGQLSRQRDDMLHHIKDSSSTGLDDPKSGIPIPPSKPKIWSLADTAVCKTPPPATPSNNSLNAATAAHHWAASGGHFGHFGMSAALRGNMFGGGSDQNSDTPPHTPPTSKPEANNQNMGGLAGLMGAGMFNGYNGLHNGYNGGGSMGGLGGQSHHENKLLSFQNSMNNHSPGTFKMM